MIYVILFFLSPFIIAAVWSLINYIINKNTKILKISNDRTFETASGSLLYPKETVRCIIRFKKVKYQKADVRTSCDANDCVTYNFWKKITEKEFKIKYDMILLENNKITKYCNNCGAPIRVKIGKCEYCKK
jgi:hypothetical protein